jgi:anti-sigma B factor antagonist
VRICRRQCGHVVVLELIGRLTGTKASGSIGTELRTLGRAGARTVVVNLARVRSIDLTGLAALVDGHRDVRNAGGELRLAGVTREIGDLVIITRLATMFNVFPTVDEAIDGAIAASPAPSGNNVPLSFAVRRV